MIEPAGQEPVVPHASADVSSKRRRWGAAVAAVIIVVAGLLVHRLLSDNAASDIAGDALYAAAVYAGTVFLFPRWPSWRVGAVAAAWCIGVELFQLTGLPGQWGAAFSPIMLVLGTVFDARDLVVYVSTVVLTAAGDFAERRRSRQTLQAG